MLTWFFPFLTNRDEITTKGRIKGQTKLVTAKSFGPANHISQPLHLLDISMHVYHYAVARGEAGLCCEYYVFSWSLDLYYIAEQGHAFRNIPHNKTWWFY